MKLDTVPPAIGNALLETWRREGYSTGTLHLRRKYLKQLLRYLVECGAPRAIALGLTRVKKSPPRTVIATAAELDALARHADGWMNCWLAITAGHGLRFAEAHRLAAVHFDAANGTIKYPTKGGETNELPATNELQRFFALAPASPDPHTPLIERLAGKPLTEPAIRWAWRCLLKKAKVNPNLHPHDLRRTIAVRTMDLTKDMRLAQHILGHQSLATTALYLAHRDPAKIRPLLEELRQWTPPAGEPTQ
jgi:integrase